MRWVTAIALSNGETTISTTQALAGYVAKEARGNNSFGFSEIFELENGRTLSEISKEEFAALSIRRKALESIQEELERTQEEQER